MGKIISNSGSLVLNEGAGTISLGQIGCSVKDGKVFVTDGSSKVKWILDHTKTTVDGESFGTAKLLAEKISSFKKGGGDGGNGVASVTGTLVSGTDKNPVIDNPLLEIHHVLITDGGNRTITDFKGTLSLVKNGLEQVDSFTLTWSEIPEETSKLTIIFTFGCDNITNEAVNGAKISWLPSKVDKDDVWEVVYDKFYKSWTLVSLSNSITSSDLSMMPQGGMIPKYSPQGNLNTNPAEFPENAVPLVQLDARIPSPPTSGNFVLKSVDGSVSWVAE